MTVAGPLHELAGRRVLVTGASSGIGAAVAAGYGALGAAVGVHYHSNAAGADTVKAAIEAAGGRALTFRSNLAERGAAQKLVAVAAEALGGLDILVNNAGDMLARIPLAEIDDDDLDRLTNLNIRPVVTACASAVPHLRRSVAPSIINVTSVAVHSGGSLGANLYASTKAFVSTYTRGLARELAPDGIRVNAVAPGVIATPLHNRSTPPAMFEKLAAQIPLGRVGIPDDCVGAFLFLSCVGLSRYLTGQTIEVNGGQYMG